MSEKVAGGEQGVFNFNGGNEFEFDAVTSVHDDPMMIRRGSTIMPHGGGGGVDSWDHLPNGPGGRRVQMGMMHGEQSEQVRGQAGNPMFSWNLFGNNGDGEADVNMGRMMRLEPKTGPNARDGSLVEAFFLGEPQWESLIRQVAARLGGGIPSQPPTQLPPSQTGSGQEIHSVDERYLAADQADGNFVVYDKGKAVWDRWSYEAAKK